MVAHLRIDKTDSGLHGVTFVTQNLGSLIPTYPPSSRRTKHRSKLTVVANWPCTCLLLHYGQNSFQHCFFAKDLENSPFGIYR